jgi:hypothetical protein
MDAFEDGQVSLNTPIFRKYFSKQMKKNYHYS